MQSALAQSAGTYNPELREFISDDHVRFHQVLNDVNPNLSLLYIPEKDRTVGDTKPWAILETTEQFGQVIIRYLSDEDMREPNKILAWCIAGDTTRNRPDDIFRRMQAEEAAAELLKLKTREDELEDIAEGMAFFASGGRNKLHTIKHNGRKIERG